LRGVALLVTAVGCVGELDSRWRCFDEAMQASKERRCEAEVSRIAGEIGPVGRSRMQRKLGLSRVRWRVSPPLGTLTARGEKRIHELL
jgi:hypothetical protein